MTLELSGEIRIVKDVLRELQTQLEESDFRLRNGILEQDDRLSEQIKLAESRAKHIAHNSMK